MIESHIIKDKIPEGIWIKEERILEVPVDIGDNHRRGFLSVSTNDI